MTSKPNKPSAAADIDELQAWAAGGEKAATSNASRPGAGAGGGTSAFSSIPVTTRSQRPAGSGSRGSLLPKVLLVAGIGLAAYLMFSFIVGIVMTILMVVGGIAALYAVYRIGRRRGSRSD